MSLTAQDATPDRCEFIDGTVLDGTLEGVGSDGVVTMIDATGAVQQRELDELYRLTLGAELEPTATPLRDRLWLRSGQALPARLVRADGDAGRFTVPFASDVIRMPWRFVRAVRFGQQDSAVDSGFAAVIETPPARRDLLYSLRGNGTLQRLSVEFLGIVDDRVRVRYGGKEQAVPIRRLYGVVFGDQSGARPDPQPKPIIELHLRSGRVVVAKLEALDGERIIVRLDEGIELAIARPGIASLRVRSDKLVYLTDLKPEIQQIPAFDRVWPCLRNQGPGGGAIRLGDSSYRSGYVMYPRTRLSYALDGHYDLLEAVIGMEDRAGDKANAIFRVLGDGVILFDSGGVTRISDPRWIKVPVTGVKTLTLEADFGEGFDFGDLCVFAIPRVMKN